MLVENQRGQGAPTEVGGADAFAAITPGKGDAALAVAQHVRAEASGHAQVAAPGMGDAHILELGEQLAEKVAAQADFGLGEGEVFPQPAAEAVATAGAEHQAVVGGALAIGDLAAVLAEGLTPVQADLLPGRFGQRFGGHQQALHR
ncbi:hypothetical protein D3C76_1139730 [compost metagenome]